jgi:hypothetical protein
MQEKLPSYKETMKELPRPPQYKSIENMFEEEVLPTIPSVLPTIPSIIPTNPNFVGFLRPNITLISPRNINSVEPSAPPLPESRTQTTRRRLRRMFNLPN